MGMFFMPQNIEIFRSKYWEKPNKDFWIPVEDRLINNGYNVHQQIEPCDTAFILCGLMENPNAFENKVLFYNSQPYSGLHGHNLVLILGVIDTILEYYDEAHDLKTLTAKDAANFIIDKYDTHQSRN